MMLFKKERLAVVEYGKKLISNHLVTGTGGNISLTDEHRQLIAISPSGLDYCETRPQDVVIVDLDGNVVDGALRPSSEMYFHLALFGLRPDIKAVVHTHSIYATTIACLGWELPAVHYLIASAGETVPCALFATPGSHQLAGYICDAMGSGNAVLMANHGLVTVGPTLQKAFATAEKVEYVARLYFQAKSIGTPQILDTEQMADVLRQGATYGQSQKLVS
jgi:L-fuculose-phosphate aldolase